jgi:hypothetical protein
MNRDDMLEISKLVLIDKYSFKDVSVITGFKYASI